MPILRVPPCRNRGSEISNLKFEIPARPIHERTPAMFRVWLTLTLLLVTNGGCHCGRAPEPSEAKPTASVTTTAQPPTAEPAVVFEAVDRLSDLIAQRLELMELVARHKWNLKQPVSSPEREQALLEELSRAGAEAGVSPPVVEHFFTAQMAAGRLVQERLISDWEKAGQGAFADVPNLNAEVRPKITQLSRDALAQLAVIESVWGTQSLIEYSQSKLVGLTSEKPHLADAFRLSFEPLLQAAVTQ